MIYYIILFSIILMAVISIKNKLIGNYIAYFIIMMITLLAGLRYQMWTDWDMYYNYFVNMSLMNNDFEFGFIMWNKFIAIFTNNYNIYLLISYFILLLILKDIFRFANKNTYNYSFITLFAIFILPSSGFRQFIAMTIILYSTRYIIDRNLKKFLIFIIVACLFHRTSIVFIIVYLFRDKKLSFKEIIILILIGLIFSQFRLFNKIVKYMIEYLYFLPSISYRLKLYYNQLGSVENIFSFGFIRKSLFILYLLYIKDRIIKLKENNSVDLKLNIYFNIYFNIYLIGYILSLFISGTFSRIESYFYLSECILFPLSLKYIKNTKLRMLVFGIFIALYIFMFYSKLTNFYPELYLPYKSILN